MSSLSASPLLSRRGSPVEGITAASTPRSRTDSDPIQTPIPTTPNYRSLSARIAVRIPSESVRLLGLEAAGLDAPGAAVGPLLESFVAAELRKQLGWSEVRPTIHHYRSARQEEVDFLLEDRRQRVVGVEIKTSSRVEKRDFRHLKTLRDELGERFVAGLVLHTGRDAASFGPRLHALPVWYLWRCAGP